MENIIVQILSTFIQGITTLIFFGSIANCIGKEKIQKSAYIKTFICIIGTIIISSIINLKQINPLINTFLIILIYIFTLKFIMKLPILKSIIVTISYYIFMALTEIISYYTLNKILNISSDNLSTASYEFLLFIIIQHISFLILILIFNTFIIKKYNLKNMLESLSFKNLKILLFMIVGYILPQILLFTFNSYSYPLPLLIISVFQIILVSILIFYYFKSIINEEKIETELITTELHNKTLIEIVDGVRTLKHDYGNIIQALNGYVVTKQYDSLHDYIDVLLKEFNTVNTVSSIDPKIFNEPAIYGVVGAKYFYATEHDITFEIDVTSDIKSINFSKPELSRIFGILLDNAIEATQKVKEKYIRLEIHFNDKKYADIIKIYNTFDNTVDINLDEIYEKGVSSKKVKSGIGLWEVKKLVNKNKHSQIYACIEKDKFVQNLIIEKID